MEGRDFADAPAVGEDAVDPARGRSNRRRQIEGCLERLICARRAQGGSEDPRPTCAPHRRRPRRACALAPRPIFAPSRADGGVGENQAARRVEIVRACAPASLRALRRASSPRQRARVSPKSCGRACHSACHTPAGRSCAAAIASSNVVRKPLAAPCAARMTVAETGLRLCGMAEEPPRPGMMRFGNLPDFGRSEMRDVRRHLGKRSDEHGEPHARPPPSGRGACARRSAPPRDRSSARKGVSDGGPLTSRGRPACRPAPRERRRATVRAVCRQAARRSRRCR